MSLDSPKSSNELSVTLAGLRTLLTRRAWIASNASTASAAVLATQLPHSVKQSLSRGLLVDALSNRALLEPLQSHHEHRGTTLSPETLAQRAIEVARRAGARYADVRISHTIRHRYGFDTPSVPEDEEMVGIGVRALVNGYWGFAASPSGDVATVDRLARDAVAQATMNADGATPRTVDMGEYPAVTGTWKTPVRIDPFAISLEEKGDCITYWMERAAQCGVYIDPLRSYLRLTRQEWVTATTDGSLVTQTRFESGGKIGVNILSLNGPFDLSAPGIDLQGIRTAAKGWELFLDADIPGQLAAARERIFEVRAAQKASRPSTVGRYTLVCDGATMASLVGRTFGLATQLDRALGYEANAGGTSFIDDPLAMVGHLPLATPLVTLSANRSAPGQLATVQWDDEGVAPIPFTLVKDGVLVDFQTTREQAAWLAPYYAKTGQRALSHGCAAGSDALAYPVQQTPNLSLEPNHATVTVDDLAANVKDGILITDGEATQVDFQTRNGLLVGTMHKITNGRVGAILTGGAVIFNTLDLFKRVVAIGGSTTVDNFGHTPNDPSGYDVMDMISGRWKGEPAQDTSYTVTAPAATMISQAVIDPGRKA